MLRFDKAIMFSPILKSTLLVSFSIKSCGSEFLLFSEVINIVSIVYSWIDLIMLLYTFLVIFFLIDTKSKQFVSSHSTNFLNYHLLLLVQELLVISEAFV